jgi:hypothetical protein
MLTLPVQNGFYEKIPPKTIKMTDLPAKTGKNTEKSTSLDHFQNEAGPVFPGSRHTPPQTVSLQ